MVHPQRLWHPFAAMSGIPGREVVLVGGDGAWVLDDRGQRYLDATASLWCCNVGHGRTELASVAAEQIRELAAYSMFDVFATPPALELAAKLAQIAPVKDAAVFFTNGGSDAIDTAGKMARRYWQLRDRRERTILVGRSNAYHGMNAYGTSLAGIPANASGWGDLVTEVVHVPHDDPDALGEFLQRDGDRVAGFIGEPVIGAGGVIPPPEGYWAAVQETCRAHGVLLIADEVICGFGRLGTWFGSDRYGIEPDLVTGAKGLTSGYLPLGVVIAGSRVREALWSPEAGMFRHGYTYSGHAAACAVAVRNLEIVEREGLRDRVRALEPVLSERARSLLGSPLVEEVRSVGLLAAVQLDAAAIAAHPTLVDDVVVDLRSHGILVRGLLGKSLQISPPFVISEEELEHLTREIDSALRRTADRMALAGVR